MTTLQQVKNRKAIAWAIAAALSGRGPNALAATTDLADVPLASSSTTAVKPNMMFMFDDSSSMLEMHMPDEMGSHSGRASYRNHFCNTIYYNPAIFYQAPPQLATGKRFTNASFTLAKDNGYDTSATATATNLSTSFRAHTGGLLANLTGNSPDTAQPAYYYKITVGTPPAS